MRRDTGGNAFTRIDLNLSKEKNVLILCEGGTELQYFRELKNRGMYKKLVSTHPVDKIGPDRDDSDRPSMIKIATDCLYYNRTGNFPFRYFISFVLSFIYDQYKDVTEIYFNMKKDDFINCLRSFRDDRVFELFNYDSEFVNDGIVTERRAFAEKIMKSFAEKMEDDYGVFLTGNISDYTPTADQLNSFECLNDDEAICYLVFDRDYDDRHGRGHKQYDEWLKLFEKTDVRPVVTSPCFELWLYMHDSDADYGNPSFMPEYAKELKKKLLKKAYPKKTDSEIEWLIDNKRDKILTNDRVDELMKSENIGNALVASDGHLSSFTNSLQLLKDHPGTMVGDFLRPILKTD